MDILFLLIPLSVLLILGILAVFGWAVHAGQFDDLDECGERMLDAEGASFDADQVVRIAAVEECGH